MLTKDLLRCRCVKGGLHPQFISVEDEELLALADGLLSAYVEQEHPLRSAIQELCETLVNASAKPLVAKGLWKIVDDRAVFSAPTDLDYPSERMALFGQAADLIRSGDFTDENSFQEALRKGQETSPLLQGENLFADLPENDRLTHFRSLTSRQVLERYNVGQVQGLLLRAARLTVVAADEEASRLRRLMTYVRFFRLLATATRDSVTGGIRLVIDGPASILDQSKRYGLQLANFFPAVCALKHWDMTADVEWKEHAVTLHLDQKSKLACPYHNRIAWVPEEISLFQRHFQEVSREWTLLPEPPFLELEDGQLFFPDFSFRAGQGSLVHLELFHRWHASQLLQRLEYCENHPELPLVLGVDRWLLKDADLSARLDASLWFARRGYFFRDYPTVEKTLKALEGACGDLENAQRKRKTRKGRAIPALEEGQPKKEG